MSRLNRSRITELLLMAGLLASPLLPAAALVLLPALWWWWRRSGRPLREQLLTASACLLAAVIPLAPLLRNGPFSPSSAAWVTRVEERYEELLAEIARDAERAAAEVPLPDARGSTRLEAFRHLQELRDRGSLDPRSTLLLVDPNGEPVAWNGDGLRHEPPLDRLPDRGFHHHVSFEAVTLLAVSPVGEGSRPWRWVAGRSFITGELPFRTPAAGPADAYRWIPLAAGSEAALERGGFRIDPPEGPAILITPQAGAPVDRSQPWSAPSWLAVAVGLLAVAASRAGDRLLAIGQDAGRETGGEPPPAPDLGGALAPALAGLSALCLAAGLELELVLAVLVALLLVRATIRRSVVGTAWGPALAGAGGGLVLAGLSWLYQHQTAAIDLAAELEFHSLALRLVLWCLAFALFAAVRSRRRDEREWLAWGGVAALVGAAAVHDLLLPALLLLGLGSGAIASWSSARGPGLAAGRLAILGLLASLVSAVAWETAHRSILKRELEGLLPRLAPPADEVIERLADELDRYFAGLDLVELHGETPLQGEWQDLPLAIWRRSPLAQPGSLSALLVLRSGGEAESFSFGLPVDETAGDLDFESERWPTPGLLVWSESSALVGSTELRSGREVWGEVRYWFIPRPGFGLVGGQLEEPEVALLRGEPLARGGGATLEGGARFALYDPDGVLRFSPWELAPTLEPRLLAVKEGTVEVASGRYWTRVQELGGNVSPPLAAVFLPGLNARQGLARGAEHAAGLLLMLSVATAVAVLLALLRRPFRVHVRRELRSYSKRLIVVYTLLLVAPMLLMNLVLVRSMESRLEAAQRAAGEKALKSAEQVIVDLLRSLEPGFGIDTAIDDDMMTWLSKVVRYDVNLYWRGHVEWSSKPELFTTGLMPSRIPGEVYSRLTLLGAPVAGRTNRAGADTTYLELYAPISLPGEPAGRGTLFLSVPLLAQQAELAAELVAISRQTLLITTGLFLLLLAVGSRLARSFTTPLMEIVRGTGRIAAGDTTLGLQPSEPELAALAEAIDEMAARIAEGRSRLEQEKQVMEGMVENINSGVVSLDRERRVQMRNRVAAELLGVEVGESIDELGDAERLAPVAEFLRRAGSEPRRSTAKLTRPSGEESEWTLVWVPVPGDGSPAWLLVVEDVTEVLRGQRLEAWAEMARMIAHEIKNPLTPIRLSTEHLQRVYINQRERFDDVFERCCRNILAQVDELQQIAAEFSAYSHIPRIDPRPGDLAATLRDLADGYRASPPPGVEISFLAEPERIPMRHDSRLIGRAVRNLVENALRASGAGGSVAVRVEARNGQARISVSDRGPGVPAEQLNRIFDPYFSTSSGGTGLGLPIARRIAEEHGGTIAAENRSGGGLEVAITMPLS